MSELHPTVRLEDLPDGRPVAVEVAGRNVAVVRKGSDVHALENCCPHAGAQLARGRLMEWSIICPMHGARFDIRTGECVNAPYSAVQCYRVVVHQGQVCIAFE